MLTWASCTPGGPISKAAGSRPAPLWSYTHQLTGDAKRPIYWKEHTVNYICSILYVLYTLYKQQSHPSPPTGGAKRSHQLISLQDLSPLASHQQTIHTLIKGRKGVWWDQSWGCRVYWLPSCPRVTTSSHGPPSPGFYYFFWFSIKTILWSC